MGLRCQRHHHGREAWWQVGVAAKLQLRAHILKQEKENKLRAKP